MNGCNGARSMKINGCNGAKTMKMNGCNNVRRIIVVITIFQKDNQYLRPFSRNIEQYSEEALILSCNKILSSSRNDILYYSEQFLTAEFNLVFTGLFLLLCGKSGLNWTMNRPCTHFFLHPLQIHYFDNKIIFGLLRFFVWMKLFFPAN